MILAILHTRARGGAGRPVCEAVTLDQVGNNEENGLRGEGLKLGWIVLKVRVCYRLEWKSKKKRGINNGSQLFA